MLYTFLGIIALILIGIVLIENSEYNEIMDIAGAFSIIIGVIALIPFSILSFQWVAAKHQSELLNREYGTHYTQADVFYSKSIIDQIREIQRERIEINGDLMRESK